MDPRFSLDKVQAELAQNWAAAATTRVMLKRADLRIRLAKAAKDRELFDLVLPFYGVAGYNPDGTSRRGAWLTGEVRFLLLEEPKNPEIFGWQTPAEENGVAYLPNPPLTAHLLGHRLSLPMELVGGVETMPHCYRYQWWRGSWNFHPRSWGNDGFDWAWLNQNVVRAEYRPYPGHYLASPFHGGC